MADIVDDIKSRLDIIDVVSQYVQVKRVGRNFKALCPFHSEKTPSFVISPEKQICHCFGCNKGGDIFTFIQEVEGVEFTEALQILADRAGINIENISKYAKKENKSEKDEYFKAHELACEFFQKELQDTKDGEKVLKYLYSRGVKDATINEFKLGFAPDKYDALYPYLLKKGINKRVLLKSGLVSSKNIASDEIYDKFRSRLMFPIFDYLGRICGFGGRALKADQSPKYLNSSENIIYNKSRVLYGLYHSKQHVKEKDQIILVEGYFDVILPYQEGVKNIAAVSGTALTSDQSVLIKRLTSNVISCFDLDEAGFEATKRAYLVLQNQDIIMKTISGFEGKDPADFVLSKNGEEFKKFVDGARDFVSFYIEKFILKNDIATLNGRRTVIKEMLPIFKQMPSSTKDFYVREFASKLNMKEQFLYDEIESYNLPSDHPAREKIENSENRFNHPSLIGDVICGIIFNNPQLFSKLSKCAKENDFEDEAKEVYKALYDQYNSARNDLNEWNFNKGFLADRKGKIDILMLYAEERYGRFSEISLESEIEKLVDKMKEVRRNKQLNELQLKISEAEKEDNREKLFKLLEEQQKLLSD